MLLLLLLLLMPSSWVVGASPAKNSRSLWRHQSKHSWFSSRRKNNALSSLTATQQPQHHQTNTNTTNKTLATTTLATSEQRQRQPVPAWKRQLPEPLCFRVTLQQFLIPISSDNKAFVKVYLLGTAHVSSTSREDVRLLLEHVQPDIIFLELCNQRAGMLATNHQNSSTSTNDDEQQHQGTTTTTITPDDPSPKMSFWQKVHSLQQGQTRMSLVGAMITMLLAQLQEEIANALKVELGGEFIAAYQYYLQQQQKKQQLQQLQQSRPLWLVFGDRPMLLTLRRCWQSLSWWERLRLVMLLVRGSSIGCPANIKELQVKMQEVLESDDFLTDGVIKLRQSFPTLSEILLDERNAYMACKLCQTYQYFINEVQQQQEQQIRMNASQVPQQPLLSLPSPTAFNKNITIVAIVGAAHVQGMVEWLTNGNGQSPEQVLRVLYPLVETKKKRRWWKSRKAKAKHDQQDYVDDQQTQDLIDSLYGRSSIQPER